MGYRSILPHLLHTKGFDVYGILSVFHKTMSVYIVKAAMQAHGGMITPTIKLHKLFYYPTYSIQKDLMFTVYCLFFIEQCLYT